MALDLIRAGARLDEDNCLGVTPFAHLCVQGTGQTGRREFFQKLSRLGILEDCAELPLISSPILVSEAEIDLSYGALKFAVLHDAPLFDVCRSYLPISWWQEIPWLRVISSTILKLLQTKNFHESEEFRKSSMNIAPNQIKSFMRKYFWQVIRQYYITDEAISLNGWRQLCRILLRHVPLASLSTKAPESDSTPLLSELQFYHRSHKSQQTVRRSIEWALKCWLEDMQAIDKDLEAYGRSEASKLAYQPRWSTDLNSKISYLSPCIHSLEYGPNPEDWKMYWDYFQPEYAREFWQYIEMERPRMPGSWIDDDDR